MNAFRLYSVVLLGIFSLMPGWTQHRIDNLDSLVQVLAQTPDTAIRHRLWLYLTLGNQYADRDSRLASTYADSAMLLREQSPSERYLYEIYALSGRVAVYQVSRIPQGKQDLQTAYDMAIELLEDSSLATRTLSELAILYDLGNEPDRAIEAYQQVAIMEEERGFLAGAARALGNIALMFRDRQDLSMARTYLQQAIAILPESEEEQKGLFLSALGTVQANSDSAFYYLQAGLALHQQIGAHPVVLAEDELNLGLVHHREGNYARARQWYRQAQMHLVSMRSSMTYMKAIKGMAEAFWKMGLRDSAQLYFNQVEAFNEREDDPIADVDFFTKLAAFHAEGGAHERAYAYLRKSFQLKDTVYNQQVAQAVMESNIRFETAQKEAALAQQQLELNEEKGLRNQVIGAAIVLLISLALVYQVYLNRQQRKKRAAERALEQEQIEANRLRELDSLKTTFFTNMSHELRTPLTLILNPLADVLEQVKGVPIRQKLAIAQANASRLLGLVNEIMDLNKLEAGKLEVNEAKVDLSSLLARIYGTYQSMADMRRIVYVSSGDVAAGYYLIDPGKVEKILDNLLSNALKFTPAGGQVTFHVEQDGPQLWVEVRDTGPGILAEDLPHIFNRFYQAKNPSLPQQGGTGIGLAFARSLARLLGGDIGVDSQPSGTTFRLHLPAIPTSPPAHMSAESSGEEDMPMTNLAFAPLAIDGEKPRLLIVEDHPEMGKYLLDVLSDSYRCVLATDGLEALHALQITPFDGIISDLMMPNMDGFTLRQRINETPDWRGIPFLLLTARNLEEDKLQAFQIGVDDYVTKPFSTRELKARMQRLIENKEERQIALQEAVAEDAPALTEDQQFLKQVEAVILENLDNPQFSVEALSEAVGYSSRHLSRTLKQLTGFTTVGFILETRLQKARSLLEKRVSTSITQTHLAVGISSGSYFTRKFTERFGKNPKEVGALIQA